MKKLLAKESPTRASSTEVTAFLESRHIPRTPFKTGPDPLYGLPDSEREPKRYIAAWLPGDAWLFESDYTIRIFFYFDEEQKLIEYKLQKIDSVP